jgi:hypothetical protein
MSYLPAVNVPPSLLMVAATLYHNLTTATDILLTFTKRVGWSVWRGLTPITYVFFEHSFYPWPKTDIVINSAVAPPIEWYYSQHQKLFYQPHCQHNRRHISWLSAQIKHGNDLVLEDITEFVNNLHWVGESAPKPEHILAAWTLETGIVLNPALPLRIAIISDDGSDQILELYEDHITKSSEAAPTTAAPAT